MQTSVRDEEPEPGSPIMFNIPNTRGLLISGGVFMNGYQKERTSLQVIEKAFRGQISLSATHDTNDTVDPPKCHPGTRVALLKRLSDWVHDGDTQASVSWLFGPAGAGKTAIARSLAEHLEATGHLGASFFLFKTDSRRNSQRSLVATLAYQLARSVPELQAHIAAVVTDDPAVFHRSLSTQFERLIVSPTLQLGDRLSPLLILIDGLDECEDRQARCLLLETIFEALPRLRCHLKFLITSRPEQDIKDSFEIFNLKERVSFVELLADLRAYEDIRIYLQDTFARIKQTHPLRATFGRSWPPPHAIERLLEKSSGFFIYAHTVMKYIETVCDRPQRRLDTVLGLRATSLNPYADLDVLYLYVLLSSRADRQILIDILAVALICREFDDHLYAPSKEFPIPSDQFVENILSLETGEVQLALLDIPSLVTLKDLPLDRNDNRLLGTETPIPLPKAFEFWHKSFSDFLWDPERSKDFHVPFAVACTLVAKGCLSVLSNKDYLGESFWRTQFEQFGEMPSIWEARAKYHLLLARCCRAAIGDPELHAAMLQYDLLDFLLPSSAGMQGRNATRDAAEERFHQLLGILECLEEAPAFESTNIFQHHLLRFNKYIREELDVYSPRYPSIIHCIAASVFEDSIDFIMLRNTSRLIEIRPLASSNESWGQSYPYFLSWLFNDRRLRGNSSWRWVDYRKVCRFYHMKERGGDHHIDNEKLEAATKWSLEMIRESVERGDVGTSLDTYPYIASAWSLLLRQIYHPTPVVLPKDGSRMYLPRSTTIAQYLEKNQDHFQDFISPPFEFHVERALADTIKACFAMARLKGPIETNPGAPCLKVQSKYKHNRFWQETYRGTEMIEEVKDDESRSKLQALGRQLVGKTESRD